MGKEEIAGEEYVVIMKPVPLPVPVRRLKKTQYHSLRRQVYFFQSISVLFCFTSCLFTIIHHAYPSTCKENVTEIPKTAMQRQDNEAMTPTQINTSLTRLTVKHHDLPKDGHFAVEQPVPWQLAREYLPPNNIPCLAFENNTSLSIRQTGTYKVSLQITYRGTDKWQKWMERENRSSYTLQHNIKYHTHRYKGKPLNLLTYRETVTFKDTYWTKSMFSEGIFFLESGDILHVETNSLPLIDVGNNLETVFVVYPHFST